MNGNRSEWRRTLGEIKISLKYEMGVQISFQCIEHDTVMELSQLQVLQSS